MEDDLGVQILEEMFKRKNKIFDMKELNKDHYWFQKETWTSKEEEEFKQWAIKFLIKKGFHKILAEKEVAMLLLNYGWSTKDESN